MKLRKLCTIIPVIFAGFLLAASCSSKAENSSLISRLDEVDRYIQQGQTSDALRILRKINKKTLPPVSVIGVYRRYMELGENKIAEKLLVDSWKRNSDSLELSAVYGNFLNDQGRYEDSLKVSEKLRGTSYASVYSEAYLSSLTVPEGKENFNFYLNPELIQIYTGAYEGGHDNSWLRNVAVIYLLSGDYGSAYSYMPEEFTDAFDKYFWALVSYDAGNYGDSSGLLSELYEIFEKRGIYSLGDLTSGISNDLIYTDTAPRKVTKLEVASLLADAYVSMGEDEEAEKIRSAVIADLVFAEADSENAQFDQYLQIMYLNSALYSVSRGNDGVGSRTLSFVVNKWPDFVPALVAYGNFAYNSNLREAEDELTQAVREAGVRSLNMKRYDEQVRIPVSDAIVRMKESLERNKDETLYVALLDLEDRISNETDERVRLSKMYRVLEHNTLGTDLYPAEIARYAIHTLLVHEKTEDARAMFVKYVKSRLGFTEDKSFYDQCAENLSRMELWEVEYAGWFSALDRNGTITRRLYEYALFEEGRLYPDANRELNPESSTASAVNLAMVYSSSQRKDKAIELYGRAAGKATDSYDRSEIMYRLGSIYAYKNDRQGALRALEYALYLNPGNGKARLLLNKLKREKN